MPDGSFRLGTRVAITPEYRDMSSAETLRFSAFLSRREGQGVDSNDIKRDQCYRLGTGQIIRVITINPPMLRCDVFDPELSKWVQLHSPLPTSMLKESCSDPLQPDNDALSS